MKAQARILGVDDAPFRFGDDLVPVIGVVVRSPSYVEAVLTTKVHVDGRDATEVLANTIGGSRYREGLSLVLIDGAALLVREVGKRCGPRFPRVLSWKAEDLAGDRRGVRAGDPYHAQTPTARRSRDGHDRVVQVQCRRFNSDRQEWRFHPA